ncbi:hypothetical protein LOAG_04041 [Loa loa]|uniref:Uncharacterized protein n=2 Tax=Loa loa TaxID=7209 RepID=A0A1S0U391_LOALO|nr:hypothetical protein LOAG_04041 [Loa loa]EFO24442.1 hypothetical protein LOAG_04041 [Loa loa]
MNECARNVSGGDMIGKFEMVRNRINGMCQKIGSRILDREELERLMEERNKLAETCKKIGYEQQEFEVKLIKAELKYGQLCRQIRISLKTALLSAGKFDITIRKEYESNDTILGGSSRGNIIEFIER